MYACVQPSSSSCTYLQNKKSLNVLLCFYHSCVLCAENKPGAIQFSPCGSRYRELQNTWAVFLTYLGLDQFTNSTCWYSANQFLLKYQWRQPSDRISTCDFFHWLLLIVREAIDTLLSHNDAYCRCIIHENVIIIDLRWISITLNIITSDSV